MAKHRHLAFLREPLQMATTFAATSAFVSLRTCILWAVSPEGNSPLPEVTVFPLFLPGATEFYSSPR